MPLSNRGFPVLATENRTRCGPCSYPGSPNHKVRKKPGVIALAEHSHGPVVGFVDDLLQFACHGGGGDGRAFGQAAADHAVPLPTGANTPGPRRNTPSFGYPDNLQSNGCCTFN